MKKLMNFAGVVAYGTLFVVAGLVVHKYMIAGRASRDSLILNDGDSAPMTQEDKDWWSGKTKAAPGVYRPHPLSEFQ